jgi:hypothetical protein
MMRNRGQAGRSWVTRRRLLLSVLVLVCLSVAALIVALVRVRSREVRVQRILAINATRALPAGENAATLYDQLVGSDVGTMNSDDPNLVPAVYASLVQASAVASCWFPLVPDARCYDEHGKRSLPMRRWMFALVSAAQSDVAAGRCDAAAEKLHCLVRMAGHLQQQLLWSDFQVGMAMEAYVWPRLAEDIMQADTAEELLRVVEAMPPDKLTNQGKQAYAQVLSVTALIPESVPAGWTVRQRLADWWSRLREKSDEQAAAEVHLRLLWRRRGTRILAGLRRYHDAKGCWPDSLEEIMTFVPAQALIDPYTGQMFVYRKIAGGEFLLYARGPNKLDEKGSRTGTADDCPIWPPPGRIAAAKPESVDKP